MTVGAGLSHDIRLYAVLKQFRSRVAFNAATDNIQVLISVAVNVQKQAAHIFILRVGNQRGIRSWEIPPVTKIEQHRSWLPCGASDKCVFVAVLVDINNRHARTKPGKSVR